MNTTATPYGLLALAAFALACTPDSQPLGPTAPALNASAAGVPFTEGLASPEWQEIAQGLVAQARFSAQTAGHAYPLLGVAQYLAVQQAGAAAASPDAERKAPSGNGIGAGGRTRLETEPLIGCFVNSLVLRGDLSGDPTFIDLLRRVKHCEPATFTKSGLMVGLGNTELAIALGIIFLKIAKPELAGSLLTIGVAIVLGLASSLPLLRPVRVHEASTD